VEIIGLVVNKKPDALASGPVITLIMTLDYLVVLPVVLQAFLPVVPQVFPPVVLRVCLQVSHPVDRAFHPVQELRVPVGRSCRGRPDRS